MLKRLCLSSLVLLCAVSLLFAGETVESSRVRDRAGRMIQPRVIVPDSCAWPNLTVLANGTLVATIFNQPSHGSVEGDVECWGSHDQGQNWSKLGTAAPHEPRTNRMNVAAGLAANGDLVVRDPDGSESERGGERHRDNSKEDVSFH